MTKAIVRGAIFPIAFAAVLHAQGVPVITGVSNGASFENKVAPGGLAAVFGTNFGTNTSISVLVGGKPVPVISAVPTQLNIQIPVDVPPGATTIQIATSAPFPFTLGAFGPGLFEDSSLKGVVRALDSSNKAIGDTNPAKPGDTVTIFGTGWGPTTPVVTTGTPAPTPAPITVQTPVVTIGGVPATVVFSGLSPGLIGTNQTSIKIPTVSGGSQPLAFSIGGVSAKTVTITIAGPVVTTPAITAVLDAAAYTSNIAQGSVFVVKGTNLGGNGFTAGSVPYQTTLSGVSITFTPLSGGAPVSAYLAYVYNVGTVNQLAAILPSTAAPGAYNVTVNNNGAVGAPFKVNVVARKFGVITADGTGTGAAIVQDYISASQVDLNRFTTGTISGVTYSPAHPGQTLIAYGTGIGAVKVPDNDNPGAIDFSQSVPVQVMVGGQSFAPAYAGRAPTLPGTDVVIFTLPNDVAQGCTVPFEVIVDGQPSNPSTLSIAAANADACASPIYGKDVLTRLDQGGTIVTGNFALTSFNTTASVPSLGTIAARVESASGAFSSYTGAQLAAASGFLNTPGTCQVYHRTGPSAAATFVAGGTNLDAGDTIKLNGPNVNNQNLTRLADNTYSLDIGIAIPGLPISLPGINSSPLITAGTYTLTGAGGKDVKAFNASVTIGAPIKLNADLPTSVSRSDGLTVSWTGGGANDIVDILGFSGVQVGGESSKIFDAGLFVCTASASAGKFTVPASVLMQLPVTPADSTGSGALIVLSSSVPAPNNGMFSAGLTAGGSIDGGTFVGTVGYLAQALFR